MNTITTKTLLTVLVSLMVGVGAGLLIGEDEMPMDGMHRMSDGRMMHDGTNDMGGMMDDMMAGLQGKTGDEFDKAFITEMIVHHEGAVTMAQAAKEHAKHIEIKQMADAIISAQTAEITQMRAWLKSWYGAE